MRERESSGRQSATRARPDSGDKVGSTKTKKKKSRLRLPCRWSLFFQCRQPGTGKRGTFVLCPSAAGSSFAGESQVNGPERFRSAPACRYVLVAGEFCGWRVITPPSADICCQPARSPGNIPRLQSSPQTSTSAPKDGGRRYTAHTSMLGSCFWSPPAMPDAEQPRQQQIRTVQAGLLRPQRPQRALGFCDFSGPWLPVPRGTQAFSSQLGHGCHGGATSFDTLLDY